MGDFVRVDFDRGDFDLGDFSLFPSRITASFEKCLMIVKLFAGSN